MAEEAAGQARATLRRLRAGTERMAETGQQVEGMQRELAEMQPLLAAAKAKVRRVGGGGTTRWPRGALGRDMGNVKVLDLLKGDSAGLNFR